MKIEESGEAKLELRSIHQCVEEQIMEALDVYSYDPREKENIHLMRSSF